MNRRNSASAENAKAKKWTNLETRQLVEYARKSSVGSPLSENFWKDFAACKMNGPGSRTPNSCKLRYRNVRHLNQARGASTSMESNKVDICSPDSISDDDCQVVDPKPIETERSSSQRLTDSQDAQIAVAQRMGSVSSSLSQRSNASNPEVAVPEPSGTKGIGSISHANGGHDHSGKQDIRGFSVTAEELQVYIKMYKDVQKYAKHPTTELARNASNLQGTIDIIYSLSRETQNSLKDTESQIKLLLRASTPPGLSFAKLTTFNILNSHKCTKYYLLKEFKSRSPDKAGTSAPTRSSNKEEVDYICKITFVTKDLKLCALTKHNQLKNVLSVVNEVYGDIPGSNVVAVIDSIDLDNSTITGDTYSGFNDKIPILGNIVLPSHFLIALDPKDVIVALDFQDYGKCIMPCNPIAKCSNLLVIKREKFDKHKLLSDHQRKHVSLSESKIGATIISVPVFTNHKNVKVGLNGSELYKFKISKCTALKVVIRFFNGSDDSCYVDAKSTVNYQYGSRFIVDGSSETCWYGEFDAESSTTIEFSVSSLEKDYILKICFFQ